MATKAQLEANARYKAKLYRIPVYIPQGQREALESHANAKGYDSLNAYTKALYEADSGLSMDIKQTAEE